jgi:hypothetical protein
MMSIATKVIVREIPDTCAECEYCNRRPYFYGSGWMDMCDIKRELISDKYNRPNWCPLVRKDLYDMEIIQNFVGKESEE